MKKLKFTRAVKITAIYILIGGGWILFSDQALGRVSNDPARLAALEIYAKWVYVLVTSALLFILVRRLQIRQQENERSLRDAEKRYRMLVEKLPAVVFLDKFNTEKTFQYISPRIQDLLGYTSEEWEADEHIWKNSLHPEDKARVTAEDLRTDQTGEPFNIEYRMRHRDGRYIWVKESASVIKGDDGAAQFWQGFMSDVTARKEIEEATQRQLKELTILHAAAQAEATSQDLDEMVESITNTIGGNLYPDNCGVHWLDTEKNEAVPHFSYRGVSAEKLQHGVALGKSIVGKVMQTGLPIRVEDVSREPVYYESTEGIQSELCVPIIKEGKIIGTINVESKEKNAFTEGDERLLNAIAGSIVNFIRKLDFLELEKSRRLKAEVLMNATTALTNPLDVATLHETIFDWLYKITPFDSSTIFEIEKEGIRVTAGRGVPNFENVLGTFFPKDNILCKTIYETRKTLIIEDCHQDPRFENWAGVTYTRGWMGAPLISRGQVIGQINLDSRVPNAFSESDAVAAQTFAHQAATALENIRLFTETRQRLDELEIISRVSTSLRAAQDTSEMFPILLEEIKKNLETDTAAIWLYNHDTEFLEIKAASGKFERLPKSNFKAGEGMVGKVYTEGIDVIVSEENKAEQIAAPENMRVFRKDWNGIVSPIRAAADTIGVISVAIPYPRKIKAHQVRLITTLAEISGNAIYRSKLFERSEEQISQLTTLRELDTAIASSLDLRITLNILIENILEKMNADAAAVLVFNANSQMLEYSSTAGFYNRDLLRAPLSIGDELTSQILLSRQPQYIADIKAENNLRMKALHIHEKFFSCYMIPLFSKGAIRGFLEVYFRATFSPTVDWENFMQTLAGQATIAIDNAQLFENLQHSNQELSLAYNTTLEGWGKALELRDKETEGHTRRVTDLTVELAQQIGISESELLNIRRGALLHDIGKMGVSDSILRKKGSLTKKESFEMRKHPQYAYDLLFPITYLRPAIDIAYSHHEWWDGSGYPRGLKGEQIPLAARIFAVIDVWDALLSDRPYRPAWSRAKTLNYIKGLSGKQFDPRVVEEFCKLAEKKFPAVKSPKRKKK